MNTRLLNGGLSSPKQMVGLFLNTDNIAALSTGFSASAATNCGLASLDSVRLGRQEVSIYIVTSLVIHYYQQVPTSVFATICTILTPSTWPGSCNLPMMKFIGLKCVSFKEY